MPQHPRRISRAPYTYTPYRYPTTCLRAVDFYTDSSILLHLQHAFRALRFHASIWPRLQHTSRLPCHHTSFDHHAPWRTPVAYLQTTIPLYIPTATPTSALETFGLLYLHIATRQALFQRSITLYCCLSRSEARLKISRALYHHASTSSSLQPSPRPSCLHVPRTVTRVQSSILPYLQPPIRPFLQYVHTSDTPIPPIRPYLQYVHTSNTSIPPIRPYFHITTPISGLQNSILHASMLPHPQTYIKEHSRLFLPY